MPPISWGAFVDGGTWARCRKMQFPNTQLGQARRALHGEPTAKVHLRSRCALSGVASPSFARRAGPAPRSKCTLSLELLCFDRKWEYNKPHSASINPSYSSSLMMQQPGPMRIRTHCCLRIERMHYSAMTGSFGTSLLQVPVRHKGLSVAVSNQT